MIPGDLFVFLDDVGSKLLQDLIDIVAVVDVQVDGLGDIQTEDAHDGLGVDHVTAGNQVKLCVKTVDQIYKSFYFINGIQRYFHCFHRKKNPLLLCDYVMFIVPFFQIIVNQERMVPNG